MTAIIPNNLTWKKLSLKLRIFFSIVVFSGKKRFLVAVDSPGKTCCDHYYHWSLIFRGISLLNLFEYLEVSKKMIQNVLDRTSSYYL